MAFFVRDDDGVAGGELGFVEGEGRIGVILREAVGVSVDLPAACINNL